MTNFFGTGIFWTTVAAVIAILSMATLIGRAWSGILPYRFRAHARFYLAPALGLAVLTIIASLIGRILPLGNSVVVPWLVIVLLLWAFSLEPNKNRLFSHVLIVSIFGIACGVSLLVPLFVYGAFNTHNDAFTYLAHSDWLQLHSFGETIAPENVTPLTTQIALYQQAGFRMGGSFLLALFQSLLNLQWSFQVYPAVIISALTVCCLAIGFPLAQALRPMRRNIRLALLALPAFSLGGLVFGANMGFLPQTLGLALGGSLLFMVGPLFKWVAYTKATWQTICKSALPGSILFSGAVFAYSELAPFLLVSIVGTGFILAFRFKAWRKLFVYGLVLFGFSILLLNTELIRAYAALRTQSGSVVGSPVEWSLLGFVAHAFGIHGGAWDMYQWTNPVNIEANLFTKGLILFGLLTGLLLFRIRSIWHATLNGILMPTVAILAVFAAGILYFRYFVPSPFPKGVGQSWNQFKLADWAHPFIMAVVLLAITSLRPRLSKLFNGTVIALLMIGILFTTISSIIRIRPLIQYYKDVSDLNRFYLEFRKTVLATCPSNAPIYLALGGEHLKFRQMATLYLYDRDIRSDWMDDVYIYHHLPKERRTQELTLGSCVVEPISQDGWVSQGATIGLFQVGILDRGNIQISSINGTYGRESDGQNWWHWVEHKVIFELHPQFVSKNATQTKLNFEYGTLGSQTLTLRLIRRDGSSSEIILPDKSFPPTIYEQVFDEVPTDLISISIETDGKASKLGDSDARMAAFIIRNVKITPVTP